MSQMDIRTKSLVMIVMLLLFLAACGPNGQETPEAGVEQPVSEVEEATEEPEESVESAEETEPTDAPVEEPTEEVVIRVSGQPPMPLAQWYIAQEQGYFQEAGLTVEFTTFFQSGAPQVEAGLRDEWDFGLMGGPPSIVGGANWGMITAGFLAEESGTHQMFVRAEEKVDPENVGEWLEGKTVLTTVGSTGNMVLLECLSSWGLSAEDVEIVPVDPPSLVSAFTSGEGDLAQAWPPFSFQLEREGFVPICDTANLGVSVYPTLAANPAFVEAHPDLSARFVEAIYRANEDIKNNPDSVVPVIFNFFEQAGVEESEENVQRQIEQLHWLSLEEVNDLMESGEGAAAMEQMAEFFVSTGLLTEQPEIDFLGDELVAAALDYRQEQGR